MEQTGRMTRQLGSLLSLGTAGGLTDGQLLERFMTHDSETAEQAFAVLVERHGPLVLRVCRSILTDSHDAEDAFQATFLVLVRKARNLWVEDSLGPWLHQVAIRTAWRARDALARRRKHEASAARPACQATSTNLNDDLGHVLHTEIGRLPERFRVPVILCDLQGTSHEQAARHLGWPIGTVKSRLSRARERLRQRLLRRGFGPGAAVGTVLRPPLLNEIPAPAIVSLTSGNAVRFAASRQLADVSAALLAQGVLTAMNMTRWWKTACLVAVTGATVTGAGLLASQGSLAIEPAQRNQAAAKPDEAMPVAAANQGTFRLLVSDPGTLESTRVENLFSPNKVPTRVVSIDPEGTRVKQGDQVVELDPGQLVSDLENQKIVTLAARAAYQNSRVNRTTAEIALKEYEDGIYVSERAEIRAEIDLQKLAAQKAADRLERVRLASKKLGDLLGRPITPTSADILAEVDLGDRADNAELALLRERASLQKAEARLSLLENYTKGKTVHALHAEIEKALADEQAREATFRVEEGKLARIHGQISACKLRSPIDGIVVHIDGSDRVVEGVWVLDRQPIVGIMNLQAPMQINTHMDEPMVHRLQVGQKANVQIDAFPDEQFTGTVTSISPRPDAAIWARSKRKVYPTLIRLDNGSKGLRPGMNGRAEVTIVEHKDAITVPIDAILSYQGKDHVAVKKPDGGFEWREVQIGEADNTASKLAEITRGLKPGEQVALRPIELLSEFDKRQKGIASDPTPGPR